MDSSDGDSAKAAPGAAAINGAVAGLDDLAAPFESGTTAVSPMAAAVTAPTATVEATLCVQSALAIRSSWWARAIRWPAPSRTIAESQVLVWLTYASSRLRATHRRRLTVLTETPRMAAISRLVRPSR